MKYEVKLIVVGQVGSGKTCLVNRLLNDTYDKNKIIESITVNDWELTATDKNKTKIKMNVWDFGEQEIYCNTYKFFLTRHSVYLLVWDGMKDNCDQIDYWLRTIEDLAEDSQIILISTKSDTNKQHIYMKDLRDKFPQIREFYHISCKDASLSPVTFDLLKKEIANAALDLPQIGNKWTESWLTVRKILKTDIRSQINYREYLTLCLKNNIQEREARMLSEYLHDLGDILHFKDDMLLQNIVVLKPEWITEAVYQVLSNKAIIEREGILLDSEVKNIWTDRDSYPPHTHSMLLRLMSNFNLLFRLIDSYDYIVAELLPKDRKDFSWDFTYNLYFQYQYNFIPLDIMSRFVAHMYHNLQKDCNDNYLCWKEGALLEFDDSTAYIKLILVEKRVEIYVKGIERRGLLAIILNKFDIINDSMSKEVTKEIPCNCTPGCTHVFDYDFLCKMEKRNKNITQCYETTNDVIVSELLDGVERVPDYKSCIKDYEEIIPDIKIKPVYFKKIREIFYIIWWIIMIIGVISGVYLIYNEIIILIDGLKELRDCCRSFKEMKCI